MDWWGAAHENVYAHQKRLRFIVQETDKLRAEQGKTAADLSILDVGCGTGIMVTLPVASLGYRVTGIDIDPVSIAKALSINSYENATFRNINASVLVDAGERYDIVIASEVLEHQADPLTFLCSLRTLLKPEGIVILTTPNGYGWFEFEQYLCDELGLGDWIIKWPDRWRRFSRWLKSRVKSALGWQQIPASPATRWEHLPSTNNVACPHLQRFSWTRLRRFVVSAGLGIDRTGRGALVCGKITHAYFRNRRAFIAVNAQVTDCLPHVFASGWYLACRPIRPVRRVLCLSASSVLRQGTIQAEKDLGAPPDVVLSFRRLQKNPLVALGLFLRRFDIALAYVNDIEVPLYRDFILAFLCALRCTRKVLCDIQGRRLPVNAGEGLGALTRGLWDAVSFPLVYVYARLRAWTLCQRRPYKVGKPKLFSQHVAYLRVNPWQEIRVGGSVAHTSGVLAALREAAIQVTHVGTNKFPLALQLGIGTYEVPPTFWLRNLPEMPLIIYSECFARHCYALLAENPPDFVYQRYSLLNYSGALVARHFGCPFVLEYNGSEVWMARNWATPLVFDALADRIEQLNLFRADLVTVVSKALRDEVVARGVPPERVLVNPNGVDPTKFHPGIDGNAVRGRLGLEGKFVIGFIGTFGPWHGASVLARSIVAVTTRIPQAHFLFIGDGAEMSKVKAIVAEEGVRGHVTFVGLVPQEEAPIYLAACDIFTSPHVGNPDMSPFFGSPTKLFEYMAMGKAVVASDLDQIGEVLSHGKTAWLVPPGDSAALADGLCTLGEDSNLRRALAEAARHEVVEKYTWEAHVKRILRSMADLKLLDHRALDPPGLRFESHIC